MKKTFLLSVLAFIMATASAFSFKNVDSDLCYSKIVDVSTPSGVQDFPCEPRLECDGGPFACTADFQEGMIIYTNIQLYRLNNPTDMTDCTVACTRSIP
ncbi:DUF6520 family protein [Chitinophaga niabensis]|uniref:DUF6520 family protein n=1 Tax=Chitinophaga niabensis TaxID=536979 RepID=UPI001160E9A0|nr:DUF6520 family protein [Chitinophaga niabensis]